MLTMLWNLSAAIRGYFRFYMPTNRAVDWLRTRRGLKWAIPAALAATPTYLGLTAVCIHLAACPGFGVLNVLVLLFFWNATKFAWMAALSLPLMLREAVRGRRATHTWAAAKGVWISAALAPPGRTPEYARRPSGRTPKGKRSVAAMPDK